MNAIASNAKALIAAAIAFLGAIQVGMSQNGLAASEVVGAVIAGLIALGGVQIIPNKGMANAQDVVDQVKRIVPPDAAKAIEDAVPAARGILKTVT